MKKLRLFDSLKFVVAVVAATFILNIAHADTNAIQSVIAYGKTEQSGTPTPTNPVPIMTNNGVLKVSKNLFNQNDVINGYVSGGTGTKVTAYSSAKTFIIPCKPGTKYTFYFDNSMVSNGRCHISGFNEKPEIGSASIQGVYSSYESKIHSVTFTTGANVHYLALWLVYSFSDSNMQNALKTVKVMEVTSADGVYVDGLTETIRDAAGHTAHAEMLLGINDTYRDEQNINTGAITRNVGVKVLDGTEDWTQGTYTTESSFYAYSENAISNRQVGVTGSLVSHFEVATSSIAGTTGKCFFGVSTQRVNFTISPALANSVSAFKQWLADQYAAGTPVIIVYPLATETTESVTTQTLTTAPVRQTLGAIMNMPIKTILTDNTEIMSGANELIKIATTKYNEESFEDVQDALTGVFNAVDTVVTQTMTQAQAIDTIATTKQTRPNEGCTAKYCLLVEGEDGTPHWYPIAGANGVAHNLPTGYTELQYIESTGTQYIDTGIVTQNGIGFDVTFLTNSPTVPNTLSYGAILGGRVYSGDNDFQITTYTPVGSTMGTIRNGPSTPVISAKISTNTKLHISLINDVITYDNGTTSPVSSYEYTTGKNIYLFGLNNNDSFTQSGDGCRIYNAKLLVGSNVVFDGIPAKQGTTVGMYDLVSGQFFTNAGTGTFTAGPDM